MAGDNLRTSQPNSSNYKRYLNTCEHKDYRKQTFFPLQSGKNSIKQAIQYLQDIASARKPM
jgi:hypothetical protein